MLHQQFPNCQMPQRLLRRLSVLVVDTLAVLPRCNSKSTPPNRRCRSLTRFELQLISLKRLCKHLKFFNNYLASPIEQRTRHFVATAAIPYMLKPCVRSAGGCSIPPSATTPAFFMSRFQIENL